MVFVVCDLITLRFFVHQVLGLSIVSFFFVLINNNLYKKKFFTNGGSNITKKN